uniref:Uncharacterized protein n=1 Tax=Anguilla anguilla TaxID=7936 RepID=A0A0E9R976_ANGAN
MAFLVTPQCTNLTECHAYFCKVTTHQIKCLLCE